MLECLADLDAALRDRGSGLVARHGRPEEELARLVDETSAAEVHFAADVTPFANSDYPIWATKNASFDVDFVGVVPMSVRMYR